MAHLTHWKRYLKGHVLADPTVAEALSPDVIEPYCRKAGHRWRRSFWSPTMTVIAFLLQVLSAEKTLRAAVAALLAQLTTKGETDLPSPDASAYCQARIRLPGPAITRMGRHVAERMRDLVHSDDAWLGHRVWVVDGSSVSMPDTPELQEAFPQPEAQKPGCGFPVAQLVALFCWTTGALLDVAIDSMRPNELNLVRRLYDPFRPGDVVLADRAYSAWVDMVRLWQQGVYCVFRLHQRRKADFRTGKRLGSDDQLVTLAKPPRWFASFEISREEFEGLPESLTVRLIRIKHTPKGFRSRTIVVVTTLLDPIVTPADEIRALYRDRWTVELNLRSLKTSLGMDVLRGQSLDVVRKEIAMHVLAYNLIRLLMWHAARAHGVDLHQLSFTGTLHRLRVVLPLLRFLLPHRVDEHTRLSGQLLKWIAEDILPNRPDRVEPRRKKRRPKEYSLLVKPRAWYRLHGDPDARQLHAIHDCP